jgi:hypothetical protein
MTSDAWKPPASAAVRQFATRCIEHPRLEEDPVCVIATEREKMLKEIDRAEDVPEPAVAEVKAVHCNGRHRRRA